MEPWAPRNSSSCALIISAALDDRLVAHRPVSPTSAANSGHCVGLLLLLLLLPACSEGPACAVLCIPPPVRNTYPAPPTIAASARASIILVGLDAGEQEDGEGAVAERRSSSMTSTSSLSPRVSAKSSTPSLGAHTRATVSSCSSILDVRPRIIIAARPGCAVVSGRAGLVGWSMEKCDEKADEKQK